MTTLESANDKMKGVTAQIKKAAANDVAVAIIGAKGVGKSRCARLIHEGSARGNKPFVTLTNSRDVRASFESAGTGSIFFSNFNTYSEALHTEILEAIDLAPPCRFISSTSESLERVAKRCVFSEALCHKLSVIQIRIPSLRERKDDFPMLVSELSDEITSRLNKETVVFSSKAIEKLSERNWPGNIAELKNILFYIICNAKTEEITERDLPTLTISKKGESLNDELYRIAAELILLAKERGVYTVAAEYEKIVFPPLLKAAISATNNNKVKAAEFLGMNRNTLKTKLDKFSLS
ncbi:MAG: sigma 54-interacting transcriptional regulator [Deferribacteraceae bacterium]|jgi:two-component system nitrogen regulation response regulator GlnG|nr:sigma 54-interacting transcriptional regulator [Deferribacteraceae bacterium]